MVVIDACHVIYEIRITRLCFKQNAKLVQKECEVRLSLLLLNVYLLFNCMPMLQPLPISSRSKSTNLFFITAFCSTFLYTLNTIQNLQHIFVIWHNLILIHEFCFHYVSFLLASLLIFFLWGHNRSRRQVFPSQLFYHFSQMHLHPHSLPYFITSYLSSILCVLACVCMYAYVLLSLSTT